jgi:predicted CXXCH cytochrome family protein
MRIRAGLKRRIGLLTVAGLALFVFLGAFPLPAAATDTCVQCHAELGGELALPAEQLAESVHADVQLSCVDCHGGDPEAEDMDEAMSPANGYVGVPARGEIPGFCGRCHSDERYMRQYQPRIPVDQELAYWTSEHGMRLKEGDDKVAECTSCHGSHLVRRVTDTKSRVYPGNVPSTCGECHSKIDYMAEYNIPVDQLELFKESVHGKALLERGDNAAPACNDCHSNHGAVPPGVASVASICGSCHPSPRSLFVSSPHKDAYESMGFAECTVCHGNHLVSPPSDAMLGVEEGATCVQCHDEGDAGFEVAKVMKEAILSLDGRLSEASHLIERAGEAGMEMSDEEFELREVRNRLVMARNLIHSFNPDTVEAVVAEGDELLAGVNEAGNSAFREISVRRKGLALSSLVIVLLIVGLYLTLRNVQRRRAMR